LNIINKSKQMHLNGGWNINIITFNHYDWIIDFGGGGAKDESGFKYTETNYKQSDFILLLESVSHRKYVKYENGI